MRPAYTLHTSKLGGWTLATYICDHCAREWYGDASADRPEYCPHCGEKQ